jgi:phospholipase/lecithinase/hemolysin
MLKTLFYYFIFLSLSFSIPPLAQADSFSGLVVFGDSLSDNGNLSRIIASRIPPFILRIPNKDHYYEGRFSNGRVWVEQLATSTHLPLEDEAVGGAKVLKDNIVIPIFFPNGAAPSLTHQVQAYLGKNNGALDPNKLYIVWMFK